jgi:two-component system, NtrC family, nitrogen regulation response regulator GlnG
MKPIWIVDDDQSIRFVLEKALTREEFAVRSFTNSRDVLAALEDGAPQVLVSDIRMPGGSGIDLLNAIKSKHRDLPVIIMTAYSDLDSAVSAFQGGAFDYLTKPFDVPKAVDLIRRAVEESLHEGARDVAAAEVPEILGQAPAMQDVFRAIGRLSQSIVTVLITGESGTGKELVANALHKHSPRASGPFVAICSSRSCSATSAARSPARRRRGAAASSRPTAARSSSTRSATCRSTCRRGCSAFSPTASSTASAATIR